MVQSTILHLHLPYVHRNRLLTRLLILLHPPPPPLAYLYKTLLLLPLHLDYPLLFGILSEVPTFYLPMLWFEEIAEMPKDMAGELKALLFIDEHAHRWTSSFSTIGSVGRLHGNEVNRSCQPLPVSDPLSNASQMSGEEVTGSGLETDNGIAAAAGEPHYSPQDEGGAAEDPAAMGRCGGMSGCRVAAVVVAVLVACLGVAMLAGGTTPSSTPRSSRN
ncbi:scavenger receptor class B, croquemort type [Penaeus vannamei]|uniref:Scavenger receptor class B, croquemort type n=1 Tax=Penaeus vannamei TaxID=6689 RepID=A0A3R7NWB1_PENVA|nr:scavenger receptor class B, croquemort type [Penaeus vannamei]